MLIKTNSPCTWLLARSAQRRACLPTPSVDANLSTWSLAESRTFVINRAWLIAWVFTVQGFLAGMTGVNHLEPVCAILLLDCYLTTETRCSAIPAAAFHDTTALYCASILLGVVRASHICLMVTFKELLAHDGITGDFGKIVEEGTEEYNI